MMIFDVFLLDFMCQKARTFVNTNSHCMLYKVTCEFLQIFRFFWRTSSNPVGGGGGGRRGTLKKCERDILEICQDHLFPSLSYFPLLYSIIGQSSRTPQNRIRYPLKPKHLLLRLSKDLWQIIFTKAAFWHFRESFFETVFFFSLWL